MSQRRDWRHQSVTAGEVLGLLRRDGPRTRADLLERTGLSRAALNLHLEALLGEGLAVESTGPSTGGRPAGRIAFDATGGVVVTAWLGRTRLGLAVTDLAGEPLGVRALEGGLDGGPEPALDRVESALDELLIQLALPRERVRGVGVALPWAVEHQALPHMARGWQGVVLADRLEARFGVPAVVDHYAKFAVLAEHRTAWPDTDDLLFLGAGSAIACGIISGGQLVRGDQGGAGELGHTWVSSADGLTCPCGNTGCLETVAGGFALAATLGVKDARDVVTLARSGDGEASRVLRDAGRAIGEAMASAVNLLNPAVIVMGGDLALADELLAGVREVVYQRATAHATRNLRILRSQMGERAGLIGPALAVLDLVLAPPAIDDALRREPATT